MGVSGQGIIVKETAVDKTDTARIEEGTALSVSGVVITDRIVADKITADTGKGSIVPHRAALAVQMIGFAVIADKVAGNHTHGAPVFDGAGNRIIIVRTDEVSDKITGDVTDHRIVVYILAVVNGAALSI